MTRRFLTASLALPLLLGAATLVSAHCEIPCGIYGDKTRIDLIYEHLATIEKSMAQIKELSTKHDAQGGNQLVRWVNNKEEHANKLQHIVTQYFMTQRIKTPKAGDKAAVAAYHDRLASLHGLLVSAMKCKQTVDPTQVKSARALVDRFCASYFSKQDLEHIRKAHGKHGD